MLTPPSKQSARSYRAAISPEWTDSCQPREQLRLIVFSVWMGAIAWRYLIGDIPHPYRYDWFGFAAEFLIGIAVAKIILRGWMRWSLLAVVVGISGFLFGFYMQWNGIYETNSLYGKITFGLSSGVLIYGVAGMDRAKRWNVPRLLRVIGDSTYSLYLTHGMILILLGEVLEKLRLFAVRRETGSLVLAIVVVVTSAILFTRVVEKPAIQAMRWLLQSRTSLAVSR
jgi:peptidoglycan/LPS O-acetylase OafA/YrhL